MAPRSVVETFFVMWSSSSSGGYEVVACTFTREWFKIFCYVNKINIFIDTYTRVSTIIIHKQKTTGYGPSLVDVSGLKGEK